MNKRHFIIYWYKDKSLIISVNVNVLVTCFITVNDLAWVVGVFNIRFGYAINSQIGVAVLIRLRRLLNCFWQRCGVYSREALILVAALNRSCTVVSK